MLYKNIKCRIDSNLNAFDNYEMQDSEMYLIVRIQNSNPQMTYGINYHFLQCVIEKVFSNSLGLGNFVVSKWSLS